MVLARDPICMMCHRAPSIIVDHVKPHKGNWDLFMDQKNCQGLCKPCHDAKTAAEDGGFGNKQTVQPQQPVCTFAGVRGAVTTVGTSTLDAALGSDADIDALLEGV
jgi:hypothetical protein